MGRLGRTAISGPQNWMLRASQTGDPADSGRFLPLPSPAPILGTSTATGHRRRSHPSLPRQGSCLDAWVGSNHSPPALQPGVRPSPDACIYHQRRSAGGPRPTPRRQDQPEARTIASTPTRTAAGNRPHAATTSARSGGTALDFTLVLCSNTGFSRVKPGSFESCPRHSLYARPAILARAGCFFWGRMAPAGFFCAASCRGTPIPEEPAAARLVAACSVVSCGSLQIPAVTCGVGFRVATASDFKSVLSRLNCGRTGAPDPPSASSKWWSRHIRAC